MSEEKSGAIIVNFAGIDNRDGSERPRLSYYLLATNQIGTRQVNGQIIITDDEQLERLRQIPLYTKLEIVAGTYTTPRLANYLQEFKRVS